MYTFGSPSEHIFNNVMLYGYNPLSTLFLTEYFQYIFFSMPIV